MQSSYKVIKSSSVVSDKAKEIVTAGFEKKEEVKQKELSETNAKLFIDSYENLAKTMIENARKQSDSILSDAYSEAERIEKEAYDRGYRFGKETGYNDGYDKGYNKAYEEGYKSNLDKALAEGEIIKNNADNVLRSCIEEKDRYLQEKEVEIKNLIINCIESILKREIKDKEALDTLVFETLSEIKNSKNIIVKSNKTYCESFKKNIETWKEQIPLKGDVFIIPDDSLEEGSAVIERDNGKIVVSTQIAMEKVLEIFDSVE